MSKSLSDFQRKLQPVVDLTQFMKESGWIEGESPILPLLQRLSSNSLRERLQAAEWLGIFCSLNQARATAEVITALREAALSWQKPYALEACLALEAIGTEEALEATQAYYERSLEEWKQSKERALIQELNYRKYITRSYQGITWSKRKLRRHFKRYGYSKKLRAKMRTKKHE